MNEPVSTFRPSSDFLTSPASMAQQVDEMIQHQLAEPFTLDEARLYVIPTGQSQQPVIFDSDENPYLLLERTNNHPRFVAAALVVTGWCAPTDSLGAHGTRPSEHPSRQRVRVTVAIDDTGLATVMRRDGAPEDPEMMDERGEGELPDALERWWNGDDM